jgi:hypothetical protein
MPYRTLALNSEIGADLVLVRISDAAIADWLAERDQLRTAGYPDRPPDIDTPTLRAWLPRPGEQMLPYFRRASASAPDVAPEAEFGVLTVVWSRNDGGSVKVVVTGLADGSFASRAVIVDASGTASDDMARVYGAEDDPDAVWAQIAMVIAFIAETLPDAAPRDPLVSTYWDFVAVDVELETAKAEALAAGLLAAGPVH